MSWHILKLDLNSARWIAKLVSIDAQSYPALTSQSMHATIGPLQDNWSLFRYVIGISGILPYNRNVTLQTLELFSAYAWLYNGATSPASRLRSAVSSANIQNWESITFSCDMAWYIYTEASLRLVDHMIGHKGDQFLCNVE